MKITYILNKFFAAMNTVVFMLNIFMPIYVSSFTTVAYAAYPNVPSEILEAPFTDYSDKLFTDDCADFSKVHSSSYTSFLEVCSSEDIDFSRCRGDESIIRPKAGGASKEKYLVYYSEKDITAFDVLMYFYKNNQNIKISTSKDGIDYTEQSFECNRSYKEEIDSNGDGETDYTTFYEARFYSDKLEQNIKYLKIEWLTDYEGGSTEGMLSKVEYTYKNYESVFGDYFTDDCADFSKVHSSSYTSFLEVCSSEDIDFKRCKGDESIIRPKAGGASKEKYLVYHSEKDITAFAVWMYFYKNDQNIKISTSKDGITYTEQSFECSRSYKEEIDSNGDGEKDYTTFYEAMFYSTNLGQGVKYLKIEWLTNYEAGATEGMLSKVEYTYKNYETAFGDYFTDDCADFSKVHSSSYTSFLEVCGSEDVDFNRCRGDESIIRPKAGGASKEKYLVYHSEKDITAFAVWMYFYKNNQNIKISTSKDGITYTEQYFECNRRNKEEIDSNGDGETDYTTFYEAMFYSANLGHGIKYLKIEWLTNYEAGATEGMLSKVEYTSKNYESVFDNFITKDGHKLYEGKKNNDGSNRFRFVSFAIPSLAYIEDGYYGPANEYEMRDALESAVQMGATAVRIHTASFADVEYNGEFVGGIPAKGSDISTYIPFVERTGYDADGKPTITFNEAAFRGFDKMLQLCNEYGVRVIFPVIDGNEYWGGIANLAAWRGNELSYFWTDAQLRDDAKAIYKYFIERTNYYTGVKYKDDPAILCWEVGNEMERHRVTDEWALEMAEYIKSLDKNHLVAAPQNRTWKNIVKSDYIDIVDCHYYGATDFEGKLAEDMAACSGYAALMLSEIGQRQGSNLGAFLEYMLSFDVVAGGCIWALSGHNRNGGMYKHGGSGGYTTYNYPGFDNERVYEKQEEKVLIKKVTELAYGLKNKNVPEVLPEPKAPKLLPVTKLSDIRWRGSAGASSYEIQRADLKTGSISELTEDSWQTLDAYVEDNVRVWRNDFDETQRIIFSDTLEPEDGMTYFYRVRAKSAYGVSAWSNIRIYGDKAKDCDVLAEEALLRENILAGSTTVNVEALSDELERTLPEKKTRANLSEDMRHLLRPASVFHLDKSFAFVHNIKVNLPAKPFLENGVMYVPLEVMEDMFDCSVEVTNNSDISITANGIVVQASHESQKWTFQETDIDNLSAPKVVNTVAYVPLDVVCDYIYGNSGNVPSYTTYGYENHDLYMNGDYAIVYGDEISDTTKFDGEFFAELDTAVNNPDAIVKPDEADFTKNILGNGGFESGDILDSWDVPAISINITSDEVHSGDYALELRHDYNYPGIRNDFPCEKNTVYTLSFWILAPDYWQGNSYSLGVKMINNTHGGEELLAKSIRNWNNGGANTHYIENNNKWYFVSWEFNSGTAEELRLAYTLSPTGVTYIDGVTVVKKEPSVNMKLKNGNEEIKNLSNLIGGEQLSLSVDIEKNINGCINSTVMCAAVYNGSQLEKLTVNTPETALATDELQVLSFDKTLTLPQSLNGRTVKLFLWKDFKTLEPHTTAVIIQ